jgi:hypothetical protein
MTDIDPAADIEIHRGFAQVTARIPLTGHVSQDWLAHYKMLAHQVVADPGGQFPAARSARGGADDALPVQAEDVPDRSWIIVRLPASTGRAEVQAAMDAVRELIREADAAEQAPQGR